MIPINVLLKAYSKGFFPMAVGGSIHWFSPELRGILPINQFHMPRRLRRVLRQGKFHATINKAFGDVLRACASRPDDSGNWINSEIASSYYRLHKIGFAHSVEVWRDGCLVGGLYGVSLHGAFFGESMFHNTSDASKVALCSLISRLNQRSYRLLDLQWRTPHLEQFGAVEIPRSTYLTILAKAMNVDCSFF
jgi:leucyl/phenylalanyl-tRNA--protein transferase